MPRHYWPRSHHAPSSRIDSLNARRNIPTSSSRGANFPPLSSIAHCGSNSVILLSKPPFDNPTLLFQTPRLLRISGP